MTRAQHQLLNLICIKWSVFECTDYKHAQIRLNRSVWIGYFENENFSETYAEGLAPDLRTMDS
jgi:hypothetical protein